METNFGAIRVRRIGNLRVFRIVLESKHFCAESTNLYILSLFIPFPTFTAAQQPININHFTFNNLFAQLNACLAYNACLHARLIIVSVVRLSNVWVNKKKAKAGKRESQKRLQISSCRLLSTRIHPHAVEKCYE